MKLITVSALTIWILALTVLFSCSKDTKPAKIATNNSVTNLHIIIDDSFSAPEVKLITEGAKAWASVLGPNFTFSVGSIDHDEVIVAGLFRDFPSSGVVYMVRTRHARDLGCIPANPPDITLACHLGKGVPGGFIFVGVQELNETSSWSSSIFSHEIGHSLGIDHELDMKVPSLMHRLITDSSALPTERDVKEFCKLHHCQSTVSK